MKTRPPEATKTVYPILRQIVNLIPPNIFPAAASATKDLSRVFTPWSHAVALIDQWQIWTGLLVHLLLSFLKFLAKWNLSFSRLAGVVRAVTRQKSICISTKSRGDCLQRILPLMCKCVNVQTVNVRW